MGAIRVIAHAGADSFAISLGVTVAPYVGLVAVSRWLRFGVLVAAAVGVLAANAATLIAVRGSASSTAAVAMLLGPIVLATIFTPLALAISSTSPPTRGKRAQRND